MKPSQTPIYRAVEQLIIWMVPITERLPKSLPYQIIGGDMLRDAKMCLDAIVLALQAADAAKMAYIEAMIGRMTTVKTAMRVLEQQRIKGAPVVSRRQYAEFLDRVNVIAAQAGAWYNATAKKARHD